MLDGVISGPWLYLYGMRESREELWQIGLDTGEGVQIDTLPVTAMAPWGEAGLLAARQAPVGGAVTLAKWEAGA